MTATVLSIKAVRRTPVDVAAVDRVSPLIADALTMDEALLVPLSACWAKQL